ncbi:uncharacterized protein si:ch211-256a21.4 [Esox lucius]|uniref:uncharacterized protein si:ch211-256a21.4 n=1 Tax=Esox lucius TaxID=8010 RepID=UPI001476E88B|nr:uncharacterized protein si:ch211-256a21.4 [Esox lucius]XP_034144279.1 uncharacterized protein si:ch211-256a21.4 [Esox lucius]
MKVIEDDLGSRFRFAESCVGLTGCLCVAYSVWSSRWLWDTGLWTLGNNITSTDHDIDQSDIIFNALEAEQVFAVLSFLMALSSGALCLMFALCWTSQTVRSFSNNRSLLMAGQALNPTVLLLLTLGPTGFFFLLSWSIFTYQHWMEISSDITSLGSSYWLGALGWALLLVVFPVVFLVEQCVVPDIMPNLMNAADGWLRTSPVPYAERPFSQIHQHCDMERGLKRCMSVT